MNRIDKKFKELKKLRKKAFIAFITAGFPNLKTTEKLVAELAADGADIIELGIPFSDPVADGAVIQEASQWALERNKVNLDRVFKLVKRVREKTDAPLCFMSYYNPIFVYGQEKFLRSCSDCGVDGVIIPDLPLEESSHFRKLCRKHGVDAINFIASTTGYERMKKICRDSRGFIYYISLTGTTGARSKLPLDLPGHIRRIKRLGPVPVCVGFGVSTPAQVKSISLYADGVIVGSAIVRKIKENIGRKDLVKKVGAFVRGLSGR